MEIVEATYKDIPAMNGIIIAAKRHWGYTDEQVALWLSGLLIDETSFSERKLWVLRVEEQIIGATSIANENDTTYELEDCWVLPEFMGIGAGKFMFEFVVNYLKNIQVQTLKIVSDPNAEGFYKYMGAQFVTMKPSMPVGRMIPVLTYQL